MFIDQPDNNVRYMPLNEKDKEALVIDMLNKGHTARHIPQQAHAAFTARYSSRVRSKQIDNFDGQKGI